MRRRTMVLVAWAGLSTGVLACNAILGDLHAADGGVPITDAGCGADCLIPIVLPEAGTTSPDAGVTPMDGGESLDSGVFDASGDGCSPHTPAVTLPAVTFAAHSCDPEEVESLTECLSTSPFATCATLLGDTCATCVLASGMGGTWGAFLLIDVPTSDGASTYTSIVTSDVAACVVGLDPTARGLACAAALASLEQCEYESCLDHCPIANMNDTTGEVALIGDDKTTGCIGEAALRTCKNDNEAVGKKCASETTTTLTGALDRCRAISTELANNSTTHEIETFIGVTCGGYDGGI